MRVKHAQSMDSQVIGRILARGRGWVFTPKHFLAPGATRVTFEVSLPAGDTNIKTWLNEGAGRSRGAYFRHIHRLQITCSQEYTCQSENSRGNKYQGIRAGEVLDNAGDQGAGQCPHPVGREN